MRWPLRQRALGSEWMRFGLVGLCATLTYVVVSLAAKRAGIQTYSSSMLGYLASVGISYFGHGWLTFRSKRPHMSRGPRFLLATIAVFALTNLIVFIVADLLRQPFLIATIVVALCIPVLTWVLLRSWVFGRWD
jgi:putative flippase GtrA